MKVEQQLFKKSKSHHFSMKRKKKDERIFLSRWESASVNVLQILVEKYLTLSLFRNAQFLAERLFALENSQKNLFLLATCFMRSKQYHPAYILLTREMAMHDYSCSEYKNNNKTDCYSLNDHEVSHTSENIKNNQKEKILNVQIRYLFALCCFELGKFDEAESILLKNTNVSFSLKKKYTEDALKDCQVPNGAAGLYLLGMICMQNNRREHASIFFRLSLKLDPFMWDAFEQLCILGVEISPETFFGNPLSENYLEIHPSSNLLKVNPNFSKNLSYELTTNNSIKNINQNVGKRLLASPVVVPLRVSQESLLSGMHPFIFVDRFRISDKMKLSSTKNSHSFSSKVNSCSDLTDNTSLGKFIPTGFSMPCNVKSTWLFSEGLSSDNLNVVEIDIKDFSNFNELESCSFPETFLRKHFNKNQTANIHTLSPPVLSSNRHGNFDVSQSRSISSASPRNNYATNYLSPKEHNSTSFSSPKTNSLRKIQNKYKNHTHSVDSENHNLLHGFNSNIKHNVHDIICSKSSSHESPNDINRTFSKIHSKQLSNLPKQIPNNPSTNLEGGDNNEQINLNIVIGSMCVLDLLYSLGKGVSLLSQYKCSEALDAFDSLPHFHQQTGWVEYQKGKAFFEMGDYRRSKVEFEAMRQLSPHRIDGLEIFSTTLWHLKEEVDLCYLAQRVLELNKLSPRAWICIGNCFSLQQEHNMAIKFFQRASTIDPSFTYAYTLAGHEYVSNEDFEKAITCYRHAIRTDVKHYNAWYGLGTIYYRQEKFNLAEYHFRRAISINPRSSVLYCYLGMVLHAAHKYDDALSMLQRGGDLEPLNPQVKFQRALVFQTMEYYQSALEELYIVRDFAPLESKVHFLMGKIFQELGKRNEALKSYMTAFDLDQKNSAQIKSAIDELSTSDTEEIVHVLA